MFNDKVAIVTGSAIGLGKAIVIDLASKGCNVIIAYNTNEEKANMLCNEIKKEYNVDAMSIKCDITKIEDINNLTEKVLNNFGKIDYLVNNAGICIDSLYEEKTKDNFMKTIEVNLVGTFLISKAVGDIIFDRKQGSIINISSTNGINKNYPLSLDYDASKAGLNSLTHNLSMQYAPYIRVNAVAPGWVKTENEMKDLDFEYIKSEEEKIFVKHFAEPNEIAKVVSFLLSDDASYINNQIISVDGGMY